MKASELPCFECLEKCEAKALLNAAYVLHAEGKEFKTLNLPCPKNKTTYKVVKEGK